MRLVREKERKAITGVPTSTCYDLINKDLYPRPVKIGVRAVAWVYEELIEWNRQRVEESRRDTHASNAIVSPRDPAMARRSVRHASRKLTHVSQVDSCQQISAPDEAKTTFQPNSDFGESNGKRRS